MIAIDQLTRAEKLELAQTLWRELSADSCGSECDFAPWHGAALDEAMQVPDYREIDFSTRKTASA